MKPRQPISATPIAESLTHDDISSGLQPSIKSGPLLPHIPDHEMLRCIGDGSYGEVWLARNVVGTLRAVKVVCRATFERVEHFDREFRGMQKFEPISRSHEGLVDVLQIGRDDEEGYFYYVMELADDANAPAAADVRRPTPSDLQPSTLKSRPDDQSPTSTATYVPKTLRAAIRHDSQLLAPNSQPVPARLPISDCVGIGVTLASALAHLHKHGLVHRDIKPSNIIFVGGVPKLADIGLVTDASEARSFVGTVGFIPPEGPGSPQADLYSLGKVLYEISTGRDREDFPQLPPDLLRGCAPALPLPGERAGVRADHVSKSEMGQSLLTSAATNLIELNEVLLKACHKDPRQRYLSAEAMLADLELLQSGQSVQRKRASERRCALAKQAGLAIAGIALLVTAGSLLWNRFNDLTVQRVNGVPEVNSIAVLPFVNGDRQEPQEYLAAILSDETRNALTNCSGLRVTPRPAVFAFKRTTNDVRQIGKQLGVRTVLAGTMKKTSNQLYVAARLINVADGTELWSASYDHYRRNTNLLDIAGQVVSNVAQVLRLSLPQSAFRQLETNFTRKLAAYRFYSQALSGGANTQEGFDKTVKLLNGAISEAPDFAEAYAELAYCYYDSTGWLLPPGHAMPEAKKNALRAIELDDSLPKAHIALGNVFFAYELNIEKAHVEFQRAIAVNPRYAPAYAHYGLFLSWLGQTKRTEEILRKGDEIDPRSHLVHLGWCQHYYLLRDSTNFFAAVNKLLALSTNSIVGLLWQAKAYERQGQYTKALQVMLKVQQLDSSPDVIALFGMLQARLGRTNDAQRALADVRAVVSGRRGWEPYDAYILLGLGQTNQTIERLQQAVDEHRPYAFVLKMDPRWDELRSDPRFVALLEKAALEK